MMRHNGGPVSAGVASGGRRRLGRISRLEWVLAAAVVIVMAALVIAEPDILEAPFENARTIGFTLGGTMAAAIALAVMLRFRVPAPIRVVVLGVPFVVVSWWLISPFFIDDVVNEDFETSIAAAIERSDARQVPGTQAPTTGEASANPDSTSSPPTSATSGGSIPPGASAGATTSMAPSGPMLLGSARFIGLAGHKGTGDAGIFRLDDGSHVLRLENLDIQNGPDLRLYLVRGADRTSPTDGSLYLGALRGNVGNQTYELAMDFVPAPGHWTALVWCEAFSVEFVAASIAVT